jgi:tetratricopeptide (TPR) repeat protein
MHYEAGRLADAERLYRELLRERPEFVEARFNLGNVLHDLNAFDEARECFRRVLEARPDHPDVLLGLGRVEYQCGNYPRAQEHFQRALALQPEFPEAWLNLGLTHMARQRPEEALACYGQALEQRPDYRNALLSSAYVYEVQGKRAEALGMYEQLLALRPDDPAVLNAAGVALSALGRHTEAQRHLERALEFDDTFVDARYNLGFVHQGRNSYEAALECYDAVLQRAPSHTEAAWGRAISLLGSGDFQRGWPAYEARQAIKVARGRPEKPDIAVPMWAGEPLAGKRILLIGEQGAGDHIQFVRYAGELARQGAQVDVLTDPRLERLLATAPGVARTVGKLPVTTASSYDYWAFLMSLPGRLGTVLESIPADVPYVTPPEPAARRWERRLRLLADDEPKVGLAWQSGNAHHVWMEYRDMPFETLLPLAEVPDVSFVGVQFGGAAAGTFPGLDVGREIGDFADHAALLSNLDLLITVDTVTAHLGGALGIPTWVMLPTCADWRWMRERSDSPWYPSMTLLRQRKLGDWAPVVEEAAEKLRAFAARQGV